MGQTGLAGVCEIFHCTNYLEQISTILVRTFNPQVLCQHATYTEKIVFDIKYMASNRAIPGVSKKKKRRRKKVHKQHQSSCLRLCGKKMEFQNILLIYISLLKKKNNNFPLKVTKQQLTLFFQVFSAPAPLSPTVWLGRESILPLPSSFSMVRKVCFISMYCVRYFGMLRMLLSWISFFLI